MPRLCLITALPAETRPLLDALKLRQMRAGHLRVFGNDDLLLLETGPGKLGAAACTAAMLQLNPDITAIMNIGIAGGRFEYAQILLAHHIRDQASGAQWYPHIPNHVAFRKVHSASILTVDVPAVDYTAGVLFDMEAAGVYSAATRYLSTSRIHSVKVISDNPDNTLELIDKQSVKKLIHDAIPTILPLIDVLRERCAHDDQEFSAIVESYLNSAFKRVHHSVNDEQQLRRLIEQYVAIAGKLPDSDNKADSARHLRHSVRKSLGLQTISYGDQ